MDNDNQINKQMRNFKQIGIVGTGPGHPDYLTKRALDYIQQADVILYDCLVDEVIFDVVPQNVKLERIEKKYRIGNDIDIFDQEILAKVMQYAKEGKQVVRIKPGDSLNYNSGGMENDFYEHNGFEVELVPGISAHLAAANIYKLNLTEIGQSNACVSVILDDIEKQKGQISNIAKLMTENNTPVCIYPMFLENVPKLVTLLQHLEVPADMPVAVCCDVSLDSGCLFKSILGECVDLLELVNNEDLLPDHFIIIMGYQIIDSYVTFKHKSEKTFEL
jgi:uroporphyrin-III C-methyltransferase